MRRALAALALLLCPIPAAAQDHGGHAGHQMPARPPPAATEQEEHEGHDMSTMPMDHGETQAVSGPDPGPTPVPGPVPVSVPASASAPPVPADNAADALFDPAAMARARAVLARENGGMSHAMLLIDLFEARIRDGRDGYRWDAEAWFGGDIDRLTIKTEGEGAGGGRLDDAEVQALWSHAIDPWFTIQAGVRQDIRPRPARSYAALGVEGLAPYWFKIEATAFLSDKGDLFGRVEASHDLRLTQRLILTPRAEFTLAAQGDALRDVQAGARLGYAIVPRFMPYVGVEWRSIHGADARVARGAGDDMRTTNLVAGLRIWF